MEVTASGISVAQGSAQPDVHTQKNGLSVNHSHKRNTIQCSECNEMFSSKRTLNKINIVEHTKTRDLK